MRLKVWLSYIFFIFITIVVATVLSVIITEPSSENVGFRAFYKEPKNQIDAAAGRTDYVIISIDYLGVKSWDVNGIT